MGILSGLKSGKNNVGSEAMGAHDVWNGEGASPLSGTNCEE